MDGRKVESHASKRSAATGDGFSAGKANVSITRASVSEIAGEARKIRPDEPYIAGKLNDGSEKATQTAGKSIATTGGKRTGKVPKSTAAGERGTAIKKVSFNFRTTVRRKHAYAGNSEADRRKFRQPIITGMATAQQKALSVGGSHTSETKASVPFRTRRKPTSDQPTTYDTSVTWDCSLLGKTSTKIKKSHDFQVQLNVNNVFGTCTHPKSEILRINCGCPNRQSFVVCKSCNTLFCDPVEDCFKNPRHLQGKEAAGGSGLSNIVEDLPGRRASARAQDVCFALERE